MSTKSHKNTVKPSQTKVDKVISFLQRKTGATVSEIAKVTGWQTRSVQGFMSGTLKKKRGLTITSTKEENKDRRYYIVEKTP